MSAPEQKDGASMRAVVYERQGPPHEVLELRRIGVPEPAAGEVRVRMAYSGINPSDCKHRSGWVGGGMQHKRIVPHNDGSGIIDKLGPGVPAERLGQRVWLFEASQAGEAGGTAAEYAVIPESRAVPLPDRASLQLGACLGVPALTAHRCVFGDGPVKDRTVLVAGGAGGVGRFAIQLARWGGAKVLATAGRAAGMRIAQEAGAHHVFSYRDRDLGDRILEAAPEGVDRIVEVALASNIEVDVAIAKRGGTIVSFASSVGSDGNVQLPARDMLAKALTLKWVHVYSMPESAKRAAIEDIHKAICAGAITEPEVLAFPLEGVADAHQAVGTDGAGVKALIDLRA